MRENVVMIGFKDLSAVAERTVAEDGKVTIEPRVYWIGVELKLDEVNKLIAALPAAVERAGALAGKLSLDSSVPSAGAGISDKDLIGMVKAPSHHERPTVTPIGNLNDRLEEVHYTPHDVSLSLVFIVMGQDVVVEAYLSDLLSKVVADVILKTGNTGRQPDEWEIRAERGELVAPSTLVSDAIQISKRFFLSPRAGVGGDHDTMKTEEKKET